MPASPGPGFFKPSPVARQLPPAPSSPQELEAQVLQQRADELNDAQAPFASILRCYDEATLFISTSGRAMTGWRWRVNGRWKVTYESGFRAFPSEFCSRGME